MSPPPPVPAVRHPIPVPLAVLAGTPVTDRKSKFQAHAARIHSSQELDAFVTQMKSVPRIHDATHNIVAWRFQRRPGVWVCVNARVRGGSRRVGWRLDSKIGGVPHQDEGRDDDGETGAGDKLLFLLSHAEAVYVCLWHSRRAAGSQSRWVALMEAASLV